MLCDCHLHTDFSGDSNTPIRNQIEQAIKLNMPTICFTDHHDYGVKTNDGIDFTLDFKTYIPTLQDIKEEYKNRIEILIGVELGLQYHIKDYLEKLSTSYAFDFIIGSSHFIDGLDVYCPEYYSGRSEEYSYQRYFDISLKRISNIDCFNSFGHLDYVVRYGPNKNRNYSYEKYAAYIDPILKVLINKDKALECNSGGYRYNLGQPNPSKDILLRYHDLGGRLITIGSDAHTPESLGYEFSKVQNLLKECGFKEYAIYKNRIPIMMPL